MPLSCLNELVIPLTGLTFLDFSGPTYRERFYLNWKGAKMGWLYKPTAIYNLGLIFAQVHGLALELEKSRYLKAGVWIRDL